MDGSVQHLSNNPGNGKMNPVLDSIDLRNLFATALVFTRLQISVLDTREEQLIWTASPFNCSTTFNIADWRPLFE